MSRMCSKSIARCLRQTRKTPELNNALFSLSIQHSRHFATKSNHLTGCTSILDTSNLYPLAKVPRRNIFDQSYLGIPKLEKLRESMAELYNTGKERYIERVANYVEAGETQSIIREDLVNLVALADNDQHLDLIERIVLNFKDQPTSWGCSVMRLYYKMNKVDRAVENLRDTERFGEFFRHMTTAQIALTMLYDAGRYQEVVDLYESVEGNFLRFDNNGVVTPRNLSIVAFAALARMNTPESFEKACELYKKDTENERYALRVRGMLAYLAYSQGAAREALNFITESANLFPLKELKTMALVKLHRYEDVVVHLRRALNEVERGYYLLLKGTFDLVQEHTDKLEDGRVRSELEEILLDIKQTNKIGQDTLESAIFKPLSRSARDSRDVRDVRDTNYHDSYSPRYNYNRRYPDLRNRDDMRAFRPSGRGNMRYERRDEYQDGNRPRPPRRDGNYSDRFSDNQGLSSQRQSNNQDGFRQSNRRPRSHFEDNFEDIDDVNQRPY